MRALLPLAVLLLATVAPLATAGCLASVRGLCVQDPTEAPCDLLGCAIADCVGAFTVCVRHHECTDGDLHGCIEIPKACPHADCPPPDA